MSIKDIRIKRNLFLTSLLILLIFYLIPAPAGLSDSGKMMIALMFFAIFLFVTEALPLGMSGILIMAIPPILGIYDSAEVFGFFGNEAIFLLISAFIIAAGFQKSGLHRRVAIRFLKKFGKSPEIFILGILLLGASFSFTMSEHAVVALMIPIVAFSLIGVYEDENLRKAGMIALAYGCSVGSIGTLLGGARNPYAISFINESAERQITFLQWSLMAMPVVLIMLPIVWILLISIFPTKTEKIPVKEEKKGPLSAMEIKAGSVLLATVILLFIFGSIGTAVIAILGATAMFFLGVIDWKDVEKAIPWGVLLLYGGAITIGKGMLSTGATEWLAREIVSYIGKNPELLLLILIAITVLFTEVMSNTAAVAMMLPIGLGLSAVTPGLNPVVSSIAIALAGGFAFTLLIGNPGNMITYSTGYYRQRDLLKTGIFADIVGIAVIYFVAMTVWRLMGVWSW